MRLVIALGGNALLQRGEPLEQSLEQENIITAANALAALGTNHQLIISHGNGPQVGLLALQNDAYKPVNNYTLDVLVAETQGQIGYLLAQALKNALPSKNILTIISQTQVDSNDPAFKNPEKFIGPVYNANEARDMTARYGWQMKADGKVFRRVVPSPKPKAIIELETIKGLINDEQLLLICGGGGGVPVCETADGTIKGIEAVVDKDHLGALLASSTDSEGLIILTDVEAVETAYQKDNSKKIKRATPKQLSQFQFAAGSMGPKIEAACAFVNNGGGFAAIGALCDVESIIKGEKGTHIVADGAQMEMYE